MRYLPEIIFIKNVMKEIHFDILSKYNKYNNRCLQQKLKTLIILIFIIIETRNNLQHNIQGCFFTIINPGSINNFCESFSIKLVVPTLNYIFFNNFFKIFCPPLFVKTI